MNLIILKACEQGKIGQRVFVPLFDALKLCKEGKAREVNVSDLESVNTVTAADARKELGWKPLSIKQAVLA